jgi:hypothetical protein
MKETTPNVPLPIPACKKGNAFAAQHRTTPCQRPTVLRVALPLLNIDVPYLAFAL